MRNFFLSISFIVSVKVGIFTLNMRDIIIYVARWWEKYLSKRSPLKHTCSWHDKLIVSPVFLVKGLLSNLKQFSATECPLKLMKNVFYFASKALSVLKIFKCLSWLFGPVEKWLDWKDKGDLNHKLGNNQLQYTYCPICWEVKTIRQWNLVS